MKNEWDQTRRKVAGFAVYAAVATLLVVALANFAASPARADQTIFGPDNSGKTVEIKSGTIVTIELPENPSTGYTWSYTIDGQVAEVVEFSYAPPADQIPGAGGVRTLELRVTGSGQLDMAYARSWENQPIDTFTLVFSVV